MLLFASSNYASATFDNELTFVDEEIDSSGILSFTAKNQETATAFYLEQHVNGSWELIQFIEVQNSDNYSIKLDCIHHGLNKFRIKTENENGKLIYSKLIKHYSNAKKTYLFLEDKEILLSKTVLYTMYDKDGLTIVRKKSSIIDLSKVNKGTYTLKLENRVVEVKVGRKISFKEQ